jgi:ABC-type bacteriocin/lantibiotic exporter with double-glycine peptidase domain
MPDAKLYTKNEMDAIIAQRALEANRDERVHLIERGFRDLSEKTEEANHLKEKIILRMDDQDTQTKDQNKKIAEIPILIEQVLTARWTARRKLIVAAVVGVFGFLSPILSSVLTHYWVR